MGEEDLTEEEQYALNLWLVEGPDPGLAERVLDRLDPPARR